MSKDIIKNRQEILDNLNSKLNTLDVQKLDIVGDFIDNINESASKVFDSIDKMWWQISCRIVCNKSLSDEKKIWLAMIMLEALQSEKKKVDSCKRIYEESHNIQLSPINKKEEKTKQKFDMIGGYKKTIDNLIKIIADYLSEYMEQEDKKIFTRKMDEEMKREYRYNIINHYVKGNPWTPDEDLRPNIISKVESYFRGFNQRNCKKIQKKTQKNPKG